MTTSSFHSLPASFVLGLVRCRTFQVFTRSCQIFDYHPQFLLLGVGLRSASPSWSHPKLQDKVKWQCSKTAPSAAYKHQVPEEYHEASNVVGDSNTKVHCCFCQRRVDCDQCSSILLYPRSCEKFERYACPFQIEPAYEGKYTHHSNRNDDLTDSRRDALTCRFLIISFIQEHRQW